MKIILVILSLVSISPWPLLTSIVAELKIQINNLKDNFFKLEANNLSGKKVLSKLYNHKYKYVCKRNYSVAETFNRSSDFYADHGKHKTEVNLYYNKLEDDFVYLAVNYTTTNYNTKVRVAGPGILHKIKPVFLYKIYVIKEVKSLLDIKELIKYLKDIKINPNYTNKINNNQIVHNIVQNECKTILENNGCKDFINLTVNVSNDKDFNKILFIIEKDMQNKKID